MKQLIVLGNRFDIHCKLKSRYSDFFFDRFKALFCEQTEDAKCIEDLEDDLSERRQSILSFISNLRNQLNFERNDNNNCDYFKRCKEKFF